MQTYKVLKDIEEDQRVLDKDTYKVLKDIINDWEGEEEREKIKDKKMRVMNQLLGFGYGRILFENMYERRYPGRVIGINYSDIIMNFINKDNETMNIDYGL